MISPRNDIKSKPQTGNHLKLPQIPSRKQIKSVKKHSVPNHDFPSFRNQNQSVKKHLSINKENNSQNFLQRKRSIDEEIKARLHQVEAAEKVVKEILGAPQTTMQLGGDMTNFQHKIELNRQLIRRQRNRTQFRQQIANQSQNRNILNEISFKPKSISSKQIASKQKLMPLVQDMKIKIRQNMQIDQIHDGKVEQSIEITDQSKLKFKSQRKEKFSQKIRQNQDQKVFRSIKQILEDPQKVSHEHESRKLKQVKFTIQQLENRLKKMSNLDCYKSRNQRIVVNQQGQFERKLVSAKSVGMIPISNSPLSEEYTFKNWNRVQFGIGGNLHGEQAVKYHRSDFQNQVDQIQKLEMKSYKSIQKMVQNRKMLIDLKLLNEKNKNSLVIDKKIYKKMTEANQS